MTQINDKQHIALSGVPVAMLISSAVTGALTIPTHVIARATPEILPAASGLQRRA